MKRAILFTSEKGGVGKTTVACLATEFLRVKYPSLRIAAFDTDINVGGFLDKLGTRDSDNVLLPVQDPFVGVGSIDMRTHSEAGQLVNAMELEANIVIYDMPGGALKALSRIVDNGSGKLSNLASCFSECGYRLTVVHIINNLKAAMQSVARYMNALGKSADHIVVRNLGFGSTPPQPEDFAYWDGYIDGQGNNVGGSVRQGFLKIGGKEITMPALEPATFSKFDGLECSVDKAVDDKRLQWLVRYQLKTFREEFQAQLLLVKELLLPYDE